MIDFPIGMKTKAPDMIMVTISGPSMRGDEVITIKHSAAQKRVRRTHWVLVSGFRIVRLFIHLSIKRRVDMVYNFG